MNNVKQLLYSSNVVIGNIIFGVLLSAILFVIVHEGILQIMVFGYFILNTAISVRWLMRINYYEMERKQKTQGEALQQAMAVSMTISPRGP